MTDPNGITRRIRVASISSNTAFTLLDEYQSQFAGIEWMPANLLRTPQTRLLTDYMDNFYHDLGQVEFAGLPNEAMLTKLYYKMWLQLRLAKRWTYRNHVRYLHHVSEALHCGQEILETLRKLAISQKITR